MLKCIRCGSTNVKLCQGVPDDYDGDMLDGRGDYAVCDNCGEISMLEVRVVFENEKED